MLNTINDFNRADDAAAIQGLEIAIVEPRLVVCLLCKSNSTMRKANCSIEFITCAALGGVNENAPTHFG